jgi:hypothetical protein
LLHLVVSCMYLSWIMKKKTYTYMCVSCVCRPLRNRLHFHILSCVICDAGSQRNISHLHIGGDGLPEPDVEEAGGGEMNPTQRQRRQASHAAGLRAPTTVRPFPYLRSECLAPAPLGKLVAQATKPPDRALRPQLWTMVPDTGALAYIVGSAAQTT